MLRQPRFGVRQRHRIQRSLADRDGQVCWYCGKALIFGEPGDPAPERDPRPRATIDHLRPRWDGGRNELDNLILACVSCHKERHRG